MRRSHGRRRRREPDRRQRADEPRDVRASCGPERCDVQRGGGAVRAGIGRTAPEGALRRDDIAGIDPKRDRVGRRVVARTRKGRRDVSRGRGVARRAPGRRPGRSGDSGNGASPRARASRAPEHGDSRRACGRFPRGEPGTHFRRDFPEEREIWGRPVLVSLKDGKIVAAAGSDKS